MDDIVNAANATALASAQIARPAMESEGAAAEGIYEVICLDRDGSVKWTDTFKNTVMTLGKNAILDAALRGASYTVTGPYMGLISSVSFSAINPADTMASHAGWLEGGGVNLPTYTSNRKSATFGAPASGVASVSALSFAITADGTAKGCFIVFGSGALATKDNTGGTLLSAGQFTGGDKAVANGDTLNVTYSFTLT